MKKNLPLVFLLLLVFLVAGFSCGGEDKDTTAGDSADGIIDDLQSAIGSNEKMKCTYKATEQEGGMESTSYVQGEKYRSEYEFDGVKNISVSDGSVIYTWIEGAKEGTKMELSCMEDLSAGEEEEAYDDADYEDYQSSEELLNAGMDVECSKVSSIDFSIPTDIEFEDQCEELKKSMEALEGLQDSLPDLDDFKELDY